MIRNRQMLTPPKPSLLTLRRARARGAALVEAAGVLPVLCMFLALMTFVELEYAEKLAINKQTRQQAWDLSAHACNGGGQASEPIDIPSAGDNQAAGQDIIDRGPSPGAQTSSLALVSVSSAEASSSVSYAGHSQSMRAKSTVFCNEMNYNEGDPMGGFLTFVTQFVGDALFGGQMPDLF